MMYHKLSWGREGSAISIFGWNICFNSQLRNQDARHSEEKKSFMQYIGKSVLNAVSSHEDQSDNNMQKEPYPAWLLLCQAAEDGIPCCHPVQLPVLSNIFHRDC